MHVYRVWGPTSLESFWTLAESKEDAIETVSLTMGLNAPDLEAALDGKFSVPTGIILNSAGETITILQG